MRRDTRVAALLAGLLASASVTLAEDEVPGIRFEEVDPDTHFADAAAPDVFRRVCAGDDEALRAYFESQGVPFDPRVVRSDGGRRCHIDYTPTLPGFRADPEDAPIRELYLHADSLAFLARRNEVFGDTLDITRTLVARVPRPLKITLGVERSVDESWYEKAAAYHFGDAAGRVDWSASRVESHFNPWIQDFLKSGKAGGEPRILVTRQLFEGRASDGPAFTPMLEALDQERFHRSKLSWEGGDLQFTRSPRDPEKLVLYFGDSAKAYWGDGLSQEEYAYVLRREFGADESVDLSGLVPHVDYFVGFLPADGIALVSQPLSGRRELALAAATAIAQRFEDAPPATLQELRHLLQRPDALGAGRGAVEKALKRAKEEASAGWPRDRDPVLVARLAAHVAAHCPDIPDTCLGLEGVDRLLGSEPGLLRDWTQAALRDRTEAVLDLRLLSLVEGQLQRKPVSTQKEIDAKVRELEELGFRVIRVPRLGGDRSLKVPWSGISYVNGLVVDQFLFLPQFGLGSAEQRIFDELEAVLPSRYQIIPVPARHMLLFNGGVHCATAAIRD